MFLLRKEMIPVLILFLIFAWQDLRHRSVSFFVLLFGAGAGVMISVLGQREWIEMLPALLPGLCLAGVCLCTGGAVGLGDGIAVMILGLYLEVGNVICVLCIALFLTAMASLFQVVRHQFNQTVSLKRGLPFLAFFPPAICLAELLFL